MLLHASQSGFRSHHSCHTALLKLIDQWLKAIDDGEIIGIIFLDFKKAFDLVDHVILLQKLQCYKISNLSCNWFKSYLSHRFQQVENGTIKSRALEIKTGVPQGSILGPLLFLLFINDLPLHITSSQADLYADDTTIHCTGRSLNTIQDSITNDLERIEEWCKGNKMYINPTKTTSMVIGSRQKLAKTDHVLNLSVGNSHIRDVNCEKLLGVFIDENLDWTAQIDTLCTKISTRLNLLSRIKKSLPLETRKLYFNGYILPILDYCCTIWGNTSDQNTNRLDKLQKRAARIILELPYDTPSNTMFKKLSWLRFTDRVIYHKALYVHRCLYGSVPEYLSNKISYVSNKNGMQLRSNTTQLLNIPKARTNTFRRSFSYSGPTLWNKLPEALRHMSNINTFKTNCFKFLLENPGNI